MGLYEDLIALGWTADQLAQYYPGLEPGATTYDTGTQAADRSYAESMAAFERGYQLSLYGSADTEYKRQLYLQEHPEYFMDYGRAQIEIGIPTDASLAASHPEYATGTRYQQYGTTAPAFLEPAPSPAPSPAPYMGGQAYPTPAPGEWGDMLAAAIWGVGMLIGFSLGFRTK